MKRLLSIELQKIWLNRASKILTIAYFVLLTFIALFASIKFDIGPLHFRLAEMGIFNFPFIWHFNTYVAAIFKLFLAIVIVSMMANEYSYGTLKQNLIDGLSKKELILSKFLTIVFFAVISGIFIFVMSLILGFSFSSFTSWDVVFSQIDYLFAFVLKLIAFFSFCLFLGVLIKRSAFALGFLLCWQIFERIVYGFLAFKILEDKDQASAILRFFPLDAMSNLIHEPFTRPSVVREISSQVGVATPTDYSVPLDAIIISILWTIFFVLASKFILDKRDL